MTFVMIPGAPPDAIGEWQKAGMHVLGSASARPREYLGRQLCLTKVLRNRRGLEVLIRKLLNLPSRPAVLMLNLWMPSFNRYSYWEARRPSSVPVHLFSPHKVRPRGSISKRGDSHSLTGCQRCALHRRMSWSCGCACVSRVPVKIKGDLLEHVQKGAEEEPELLGKCTDVQHKAWPESEMRYQSAQRSGEEQRRRSCWARNTLPSVSHARNVWKALPGARTTAPRRSWCCWASAPMLG